MNTVFQKLKGDRVIWMAVLFLGLISLLAVYSSISSLAFKREGGSTMHFLMKHGIMLVTGGVIMYYVSKQQFTIYSRLSQLLIGVMAVLLLLTLLLGSNINDASRWITIPIINQSFQTSDPAKVVLIVYLARVLGKNQDRGVDPARCGDQADGTGRCDLWPDPARELLHGGLCSSPLCMIIMFIGQVPTEAHGYVIVGGAVGAFVLLLVVLAKTSSPGLLPRLATWVQRIESFTAGGADPDANYQVEHAKIAIASGGFLPNGPGSGASRNWSCPTPTPT
jgi:cell division protein FtsW